MPIYRMSLALGFFTKFYWRAQAAFYGAANVPSELHGLLHASHYIPLKATQVYDELLMTAPADSDTAPVGKSAIHRSGMEAGEVWTTILHQSHATTFCFYSDPAGHGRGQVH